MKEKNSRAFTGHDSSTIPTSNLNRNDKCVRDRSLIAIQVKCLWGSGYILNMPTYCTYDTSINPKV